MIGRTNGRPVSITGLGCHVPERILSNDELATMVATSDEWIRERTGIRERRIAADDEALTDVALPACRRALEMAGVEPGDVLTLECEFVRVRGPIAKGKGRALVGDELAAEAMLTVFIGE